MRKWLYLGLWAKNQKTKGTFFSQTFKVEEEKVPLFFWFLAFRPRYSHFMISIFFWKNYCPRKKNSGAPHKRPRWLLWVFISKVMYFEAKKNFNLLHLAKISTILNFFYEEEVFSEFFIFILDSSKIQWFLKLDFFKSHIMSPKILQMDLGT